ncbi:hypothetical protein [Gordonia humi]|uniref:Antitoxin VbhA domain-containing protein n=1 Tax=Gordonia humi TaxID=686429 RepID=A0A840F6S2_9ACTN|nr:hypothetical protein [Gordonia humi]MBB4138108.1 hypothetical protein [Gordonia humi]
MASPITTSREADELATAAATAGHVMAGMPPTGADLAAARRVARGQSTAEQEADRMYAEIVARRTR